jgi:hypothetical protein
MLPQEPNGYSSCTEGGRTVLFGNSSRKPWRIKARARRAGIADSPYFIGFRGFLRDARSQLSYQDFMLLLCPTIRIAARHEVSPNQVESSALISDVNRRQGLGNARRSYWDGNRRSATSLNCSYFLMAGTAQPRRPRASLGKIMPRRLRPGEIIFRAA